MRIFNSGVDWLTLTGELRDDARFQLSGLFEAMSVNPEEWSTMGYKGKRCTETGVRYGSRQRISGETDELFIASNAVAGEAVDFLVNKPFVNCTRMDLQVTVYLPEAEPDRAKNAYEKIQATKAIGQSVVGRRKTSLIQSDTGDTLYVGSRKGGRKFFRFYDKSYFYGCERGSVWRQEVQYGRKFANNVLETYTSWPRDMRQEKTIELVAQEFETAVGFSMVISMLDSLELIPEQAEKESGIEGKLRWLKKCVRPVIVEMIKAGYSREAIEALELEKRWTDLTP